MAENLPILIVMTRWPAPGRCKNRLAKELGLYKAAQIQDRLIMHTLKVALSLEKKGLLTLQLAISGIQINAAKRIGKTLGVNNIKIQSEGNLGLRMRQQIIKSQQNRQIRNTILIGSDLPNLCELDLINAINALRSNDLVFGPSQDGGYWLLGLADKILKPVSTFPFTGIPWGTNKVLESSLEKAKVQKKKCYLLQLNNDLDNLHDFKPWYLSKEKQV